MSGLSFVGQAAAQLAARQPASARQQLKWLLTGAAVTVAAGLIACSWPFRQPASGRELRWPSRCAALPVGIGIGILKYRLYDIDRIISRTLAYAIVTGLLIGVYAGLVLLATRVLSVHTPVAVAASTLAAAALFNPLRRAGAAAGGPAVQPRPV